MINVLYITHESGEVLGSTHSLVNMLHSVKNEVHPVIIFPHKGKAYDYLVESGYTCYVVQFKLNIAPKRWRWLKLIPRKIVDSAVNVTAIRKISKIVKRENVQLIHSNSSVFTIGYDAAKVNALKHVWHLREFQDLDFGMQPFSGWRQLKMKINSSDAVIAITKTIAEHFDVNVGNNGYIIYDAVRSKDEICMDFPKKHILLFCGNVIPEKGAETALDIFIKFVKQHENYQLLYLGNVNAEYKEYLSNKATVNNVLNKVQFLGYQRDVKKYMREATALLMCSRNEAQGRVTIEAMFYGCPVIGYKAGGTQEIIKDGVNGFWFDSIDEAINKLNIIASNNIRSVIERSQKYVTTHFSEETYKQKILSIYCTLLHIANISE